MAVAFFLPVYGRLVPPFIALMFLNWLIDGRFVKNLGRLCKEKCRLQIFSFALIYILYLAGMAWSTNSDYGLFDLEVKMSLLIFPLIFSTVPFTNLGYRNKIMFAFVAGCAFGSLLLLGHAGWSLLENQAEGAFYYIPLGWHFHPSYLSMYLNLAIVFLMMHYQEERVSKHLRVILTLLILLFLLMTFLLSSKAGLIALLISVGLVILFSMFNRRSFFPGVTFLGMFITVLLFSYFFAPFAFNRFSAVNPALNEPTEQATRVAPESSADRLAIWNSSLTIIRNNFWFGTGTGDVKDALLHSYSTGKIVPAYRLRLNAHSQYLQTFITLGIVGFLVLVLMLALPAIIAVRRRDMVYLLFLFVFGFNILVESMLEEQAGVVYYAFFNILLFSMQKETGKQLPVSPFESK